MWVEAESVKENLEQELQTVKDNLQRTPNTEKKVMQLSRDLTAQKEKVKALTPQYQSVQAAAASAREERDKSDAELEWFAATMKENDKAHKELLVKMDDSLSQAKFAYERMIKGRDLHKSGEADLKVQLESTQKAREEEVSSLKL